MPDQNLLVEKLRGTKPFAVAIGTTMPLQHAFDIDSLVAQIAGALSLAGWKPQPGIAWGSDDRPSGVSISVREGDDEASAASDIIAADLNAFGIVSHREAKPFAGPKPPKPEPPHLVPALGGWNEMPDIQIVVGIKP